MTMKNYHVRHIRSNVVVDNAPKLPSSDKLELGEIAINYATGYETLSIKNADGNIVTFSSDSKYEELKNKIDELINLIKENEKVTSSALNDLNMRVSTIADKLI